MGPVAISFDGDGTLWDFESSMRTAIEISARRLNEAGLGFGGAPIESAWLAAVREEVATRPELRGASMAEIRLAAFEEAIRRCDAPRAELAQSVFESYMNDRLAVLRLYPETAAALAGLRPRFRLALVTNGNTDPAPLGLGDAFEQLLFASECGTMKPDPAIYALAAERLGVEAGACLHVGDHPHEDVEAARRAGMRSIWLNRDRREWPDSLPSPEAEIADLSALSGLL